MLENENNSAPFHSRALRNVMTVVHSPGNHSSTRGFIMFRIAFPSSGRCPLHPKQISEQEEPPWCSWKELRPWYQTMPWYAEEEEQCLHGMAASSMGENPPVLWEDYCSTCYYIPENYVREKGIRPPNMSEHSCTQGLRAFENMFSSPSIDSRTGSLSPLKARKHSEELGNLSLRRARNANALLHHHRKASEK
ncbi:hypothetical protein CEXT_440021 [Caerostris extrusa]|uniref:Uncharacterized protein n=1 Tax=Caerostris extrusa TaxID=172846 RepID=A0AAV4SDK3_CAEEX|nr:hypothetical protein CEXT_440021 [Caerostris extrusa]